MPPLEAALARTRRPFLSLTTLLLGLLLAPSVLAQDARLESLGGIDLLIEDDSNVFTNPALAAIHSNRVFFSLGIDADGNGVGFDPHGGGFVRIRDVVTLGVVLNRSPREYGFDRAMWPVMAQYMPAGPGGLLEGPDGPVEETAPLRFPADIFIAFGNPWSKLRLGINIYYAGGATRQWDIDDSDQDQLIEEMVTRKQTHLISGTVGLSGGSLADRTRGEGWVRVSFLSAWHDERGCIQTAAVSGMNSCIGFEGDEVEPTIDQVVALDRDLRIGGGARLHFGDAEQGFVLSPGVEYDYAQGVFRFDDNMVAPDSDAENALRNAHGHDFRGGLGVAWRGDDLLVSGTASIVVRNITRIDSLEVDEGIEQEKLSTTTLSIPELSIGAEYRVHPVLFVRAGIRSSVVGGRTIGSALNAVGDADDPYETGIVQNVGTNPVHLDFAATGGLGLHVKRFRADAIVGGLFLGGGNVMSGQDFGFFSRIDLGFDFD
jgi:hypothetical protein